MNNPCIAPCVTITLYRPWWQRALEAWLLRPTKRVQPEAAQPGSWAEADWRSLRGLSASTLRDIGAPEWVHEARAASRAAELDWLRL